MSLKTFSNSWRGEFENRGRNLKTIFKLPPGNLKTFSNSWEGICERFQIPGGGDLGGGEFENVTPARPRRDTPRLSSHRHRVCVQQVHPRQNPWAHFPPCHHHVLPPSQSLAESRILLATPRTNRLREISHWRPHPSPPSVRAYSYSLHGGVESFPRSAIASLRTETPAFSSRSHMARF